ncbi:hypothetical protein ABPG72_005418 [Tetrahymena utriculariae]
MSQKNQIYSLAEVRQGYLKQQNKYHIRYQNALIIHLSERISVSYHYKDTNSTSNNQNQANSSNITEIPMIQKKIDYCLQAGLHLNYIYYHQKVEVSTVGGARNSKHEALLKHTGQMQSKCPVLNRSIQIDS